VGKYTETTPTRPSTLALNFQPYHVSCSVGSKETPGRIIVTEGILISDPEKKQIPFSTTHDYTTDVTGEGCPLDRQVS
jgi:hypothetical protein